MAGQPAPKRTGPRRSRGESKPAIAHAETTVTAEPTGWTLAAFKAYLQGVKLEMGRVSWPTGRELQAATTVVMVTLILFAGYLGALDFVLKRFFR
jgi:preprotein translocase SecE subunit